jgi:hypothetical protein
MRDYEEAPRIVGKYSEFRIEQRRGYEYSDKSRQYQAETCI